MIAWYGSKELKALAMKRLREHRDADEFLQGVYFSDYGRGCHLGCLTHSGDDSHAQTERLFGIELQVAYWLESVFEALPADKAGQWVIDSTVAIPVGADLSRCHHHLAYWLLGPDSPSGEGNAHKSVATAVAEMRDLHGLAAAGQPVSDGQWSAALAAAARSASESAWSAARSSAWSAAESAWSAAAAARSAARSSAAVWSSAWESIAEKSIEIFSAAPVREPRDDERCDECVAESLRVLRKQGLVMGASDEDRHP